MLDNDLAYKQFHQRIPYLIPWKAPDKTVWFIIIVPGQANKGRIHREAFYYGPDGTCNGGSIPFSGNETEVTLAEFRSMAKKNLRDRWKAHKRDER
jgi:hypothetical protein